MLVQLEEQSLRVQSAGEALCGVVLRGGKQSPSQHHAQVHCRIVHEFHLRFSEPPVNADFCTTT
jgi:3-deoxy-D-arabino-heptulosonate 7-phosphate (DAHP) synthase